MKNLSYEELVLKKDKLQDKLRKINVKIKKHKDLLINEYRMKLFEDGKSVLNQLTEKQFKLFKHIADNPGILCDDKFFKNKKTDLKILENGYDLICQNQYKDGKGCRYFIESDYDLENFELPYGDEEEQEKG